MSGKAPSGPAGATNRADVEDFLFHEAALLDAWQLDDWLALLCDDCSYRVPSNDAPDAQPQQALFMIADDIHRIRERVVRLKDRNAHAEFPHSRTRRLISNVRIAGRSLADGVESLRVHANFIVYRHRRDADVRCYVGCYRYLLRGGAEGLRIAEREAVLDAMELGAMGLVSFIL